MSQQYIGEIRMFGGNFAPQGWAFCNGALLPISGNEALFSLIGTTYGGDGQTNFALPDLQGRIPMHAGAGYAPGARAGQETVTLSAPEMARHTHQVSAQSGTGDQISPAGAVWATSNLSEYSAGPATLSLSANSTTPAGGNQPHDNMMPFLAMNFIIALEGLYPSQP